MSGPNVVVVHEFYQNMKDIAKNPRHVKYASKRQFYSSNNGGLDYIGYIDSPADKKKELMDFVGYTGNEEKSDGVFDQEGMMNHMEKSNLRKRLRETDSIIWNMVISFESEFGEKNCRDTQTAQRLLKEVLPRFFSDIGMTTDNMTWYAGLHRNTDNTHIHLSFFENKPMRYRSGKKGLHYSTGFIKDNHFTHLKTAIESKLTDWKIWEVRNEIISQSKTLDMRKLTQDFVRLGKRLPKQSKLGYNSDNMTPFRRTINQITRKLIYSNPNLKTKYTEFTTKAREKDRLILGYCKGDMTKYEKMKKADKYMNDLEARIGNLIIGKARKIADNDRVMKHKGNNTPRGRRKRKKYRRNSLEEALRLAATTNAEAMRAFQEYIDKLDENERIIQGHEM